MVDSIYKNGELNEKEENKALIKLKKLFNKIAMFFFIITFMINCLIVITMIFQYNWGIFLFILNIIYLTAYYLKLRKEKKDEIID